MAVMIEGLGKVVQRLVQTTLKGTKEGTISLSYGGPTAPYAIFVHEDLYAFHPVGNAKFLERPFRQLRQQMIDMAIKRLTSKRSLRDALVDAIQLLVRASLAQVPVDTGALKKSHLVEYSERKM